MRIIVESKTIKLEHHRLLIRSLSTTSGAEANSLSPPLLTRRPRCPSVVVLALLSNYLTQALFYTSGKQIGAYIIVRFESVQWINRFHEEDSRDPLNLVIIKETPICSCLIPTQWHYKLHTVNWENQWQWNPYYGDPAKKTSTLILPIWALLFPLLLSLPVLSWISHWRIMP
jgi:hypothetical protein